MADSAATAEIKEKVVTFARGFAEASGLDVSVRVSRDVGDSLTIAFDGPDSRFLVGRAGQVLDALQSLALNAYVRRGGPRVHLLFDADNYRERREKVLIDMAHDLAAQVEESGQEAVLDPLPSMERRIVHNALSDHPGVATYSEGEEPDRYIVIAPKG